MTNRIPPSLHHVGNKIPPLTDQFGRTITYLRLSVTDRCNLRCRYCLPKTRAVFQPRSEILHWEELMEIVGVFTALGIRKLRITGGEAFTRKGILGFLQEVCSFPDLHGIYITTNGVAVAALVPQLKALGISGINLSLDTLNRARFQKITHSDSLHKVLATCYQVMDHGIPLKLNTVVKEGFNTDEIANLARLAENNPIEVRFIEEMPQLTAGEQQESGWDFERILAELQAHFPDITPLSADNGTARRFQIPDFAGKIGIIAGHSRLFCSTCNRIRVTATGQLKTCLYDNGVLDLKKLLRSEAGKSEIQQAIRDKVGRRALDGFEAFATRCGPVNHTMAAIGG